MVPGPTYQTSGNFVIDPDQFTTLMLLEFAEIWTPGTTPTLGEVEISVKNNQLNRAKKRGQWPERAIGWNGFCGKTDSPKTTKNCES